MKSLQTFIRISLMISALGAVSCGSAVSDAHSFVPNKPPVIGTVTQAMPDGSAVNRSAIVRNMSIAVTVPGYDPEGRALTWSAVSAAGSAKKPSVTVSGYSFTFVTEKIGDGNGVSIVITAADDKHASASVTFDVGTGLTGTLVTLTPQGSPAIPSAGSVKYSFTASAKGYFETLCSDDASLVDSMLTGTRTVYDTPDENGALAPAEFTVRGAASAADGELTLPAAQGAHTVWAVFYDQNGTKSKVSSQVTVDDSLPDLLECTPEYGAEGVRVSTPVKLTFSKEIDPATLANAVKISCLASEYAAALVSNTGTSAIYSTVQTLPNSAECTIIISGIADTLGNMMAERRIRFTTAAGPVITYDANGATGTPPACVYSAAGAPVTAAAQGQLNRAYHIFMGWSEVSGSAAAEYAANSPFTMPSGDLTLFAVWYKIPIVSVMIPTSQIWLQLNATAELTAAVTGPNGEEADPSVSWSITDGEPVIADIYSSYDPITGKTSDIIRATAPGMTRITATAWNGVSAECTVHVSAGSPLPKAMSISLGEKQTIAPIESAVWSSSDPETVEVSASASAVTITAKKKGAACIGAAVTTAGAVSFFGSFPVTVTTVEEVSGGENHTIVLRSDGTVWTAGGNQSGQLGRTLDSGTATSVFGKVDTSAIGPVIGIEAGMVTSFVISADHTLYGCGFNGIGELGLGYAGDPKGSLQKIMGCVSTVSAGGSHSLVTSTKGELFVFGYNGSGQLGTGDPADRLFPERIINSALSMVNAVSARSDTSLAIAGTSLYRFGVDYGQNSNSTPAQITLPQNSVVKTAAAGSRFIMVIDTNGKLLTRGINTRGQLGWGNKDTISTDLTAVPGFEDRAVTSCAAGTEHGLVLTSDNIVYAFGSNNLGQIGNGENDLSGAAAVFTPVEVPLAGAGLRAGAKAAAVAAGTMNSFIITGEGELCGFGNNMYGQLGVSVGSGIFPTQIASPQKITLPADITW